MSSPAVRIGLDLAKSVFQVHGVNAVGKVVIARTSRRAEMLTFFANLPAWRWSAWRSCQTGVGT